MNSRTLVLRHGHELLFDTADSAVVDAHTWYAHAERGTHYACTNVTRPDGSRTIVRLHRLLTGAAPGVEVDHANRNGLDNRRSNLRQSTPSQNKANRPAPRHNTSGYKGVSRSGRRWTAYITVARERRSLGVFDDVLDAARAYNDAAREAWGEFAYLNDVSDRPQAAHDGGTGCPGHVTAVPLEGRR